MIIKRIVLVTGPHVFVVLPVCIEYAFVFIPFGMLSEVVSFHYVGKHFDVVFFMCLYVACMFVHFRSSRVYVVYCCFCVFVTCALVAMSVLVQYPCCMRFLSCVCCCSF